MERHKSTWAEQTCSLLRDAIALKNKLGKRNSPEEKISITALENRMDSLLEIPLDLAHPEAVNVQKRLKKSRNSILTFLHYHKVPPDNNTSERAVRNIKVKQKISGQFKSSEGAEDFCVIRSIIDNLIKRSQNVLENLVHISRLVPE